MTGKLAPNRPLYSYLTDWRLFYVFATGDSGAGTTLSLTTSPIPPNTVARVDTITIGLDAFSATVARLNVYKGPIAARNRVAGTGDARNNTLVNLNLYLQRGEFLTFQVVNMDNNQLAFITAYGQYLD